MIFTLSKPFYKSMNSEPITEIDIDFDRLTAKDYIDSFSNQNGNEVDLIAYGKLGFQQAKNLIAKAMGCIPEALDDISLLDYHKLEQMCFNWFLSTEFSENEEVKFDNISVKDYIAIRSQNSLSDGSYLSNRASAKTRIAIISFATKKKINELETTPIREYIALDIQCASFFSILV